MDRGATSRTQPEQNRLQNLLQKKLRRQVGRAIADYGMIEAGDRVMVCVSGGKDSLSLLLIKTSLCTRLQSLIPESCAVRPPILLLALSISSP